MFDRIFNIKTKIIVIKIVALFWFFTKIYSWKLWISDRFFPVLPVFDSLELSNELHFLLFLTSLTLLIFIFFKSDSRKLICCFLVIEIFSCLLDQMRWQPWEYQYLLMFTIFLCSHNSKNLVFLNAILICFTYIYSGLHKINGGFLYNIWDILILKRCFGISQIQFQNPVLHYFGLIIPIIEIALGLGLLLAKRKFFFILMAILMHLLIIIFLSPIGINHNEIVIPLNILMMVLLLIFFKNSDFNFLEQIKTNIKSNFLFCVLIIFMPILNFFDAWDNYLSFNLYSGNTKTIIIQVDNITEYPKLKLFQSKNKLHKFSENTTPINIDAQAFSELKVPICKENRTFLEVKKQWNIKFKKTKNRFFIYKYPFTKPFVNEIQ